MSRADFAAAAADFPEPFRLLILATAGSTNDEAAARARTGAAEGLVVLAERQLAGRGRRGAAWHSPPGEALAFSIVVRPAEPKSFWPRLALVAGVAVAEALESMGLRPGIKWPNDLWLGGKKVAGILVEAGADFAIVGIGLNINTADFPEALAEIATSLRIETGRECDRAEVLAAIIARFAVLRGRIGEDFPEIVTGVATRCVLTGRRVTLTTGGRAKSGTVEGIGSGGELLLRTDDGLERLIQADDVRPLDP